MKVYCPYVKATIVAIKRLDADTRRVDFSCGCVAYPANAEGFPKHPTVEQQKSQQ